MQSDSVQAGLSASRTPIRRSAAHAVRPPRCCAPGIEPEIWTYADGDERRYADLAEFIESLAALGA